MNKYDIIRSTKLHKIFKPFYAGIGHVLVFHRIYNENDYVFNKNLHVTQGSLEDIVKYFISNNIDIVSLDECYNRITAKSKVKRFVAFTFDDGYIDNLTHALPVFEKYSVPFTLFLTTGFPDHTVVLWWYLLENLVMESNLIQFKDGDNTYSYKTGTMEEKNNAFWSIRRYILESDEKNLIKRLQTIFNMVQDDLFDLTAKLAMSWDQVIELSNHPLVTIGAHTVNHLALSKLSEDTVIKEINESIEIIEKKIKKPVLYLAYPIGSSSAASVREFNITRGCNLKMAFTAKDGNIFKYHTDNMYSLPRISVDDTRGITFVDLYINGFTPFLNTIFG
ncbi:MAG: polysaccharide deacetylase family protein [Bacteroidales bacterium]|nr:polysaccharide deacetylase family protein [Bacteroidales bacterium]